MNVEDGYPKRAWAWLKHCGLYVRALAKWLCLAAVIGVLCGVVGSLFHIGVHQATALRAADPWLLWCLPLAGLVIVGFYKLVGTEGQGTNDIIDAVHLGRKLSIWLPRKIIDLSPFHTSVFVTPVRRLRRTGGRRPPNGRHHRLQYRQAVPSG